MAIKPAVGKITLPKIVQDRLLNHVKNILVVHKKRNELRDKMIAIDIAYARYQETHTPDDGTVPCDVFGSDNIIAPIVISQVDSAVAYLADVFLSGAPLFPVVSTPKNRLFAEQLETLVDDHANLGGYARQLLVFLRDAVKYNFAAIEADWDQMDQFSVVADFEAAGGKKTARAAKSYTKLRRLDPYNTIFDNTVAPGDISNEGDYAGDVQIISRTKLKRLIGKLIATGEAYNISDAVKNGDILATGGAGQADYYIHPVVNNYISARRPINEVDWFKYFGEERVISGPGNFELTTVYARIIPTDYGMSVPQPGTPQIWKLRVINGSVLISAKRIISAQDVLPIFFGQPLEDGMKYQTKSIAESEIPFQEAATKLFNIRFSAARRAVSDRALYNPDMIKPSDINSPTPAPKIPVRGSAMKDGNPLEQAYRQIPFDMRGTETTLQDAATLVDFSKQLSGLSSPRQGQFQKGNKSVQEWNDTMGGSEGRLRLPALALEYQVFMPLKEAIKLNIFQYGEDAVVVSQQNGEVHSIDLNVLRQQVLAFRVADGYSPKAKLASVEMIMNGLNMISQIPILQQAYGPSLPAIFAHLMQLGGVRGLEEYAPEVATAQQPVPTGLGANSIQPAVQQTQTPTPNIPVTGTPQAPRGTFSPINPTN